MPTKQIEHFINPDAILEQLGMQQGMIVADLGCGAGYKTISSAKIVGASGMVFAVDIQRHLLDNIASKAKIEGFSNIKTVWADLEVVGSTRIAEDSCDMVIIANTLYQSRQPEKIMEEAKRIAKPMGEIVVIDWKSVHIPLGPALANRITKERVLEIAEQLNLTLDQDFIPSEFHYGLTFSK